MTATARMAFVLVAAIAPAAAAGDDPCAMIVVEILEAAKKSAKEGKVIYLK